MESVRTVVDRCVNMPKSIKSVSNFAFLFLSSMGFIMTETNIKEKYHFSFTNLNHSAIDFLLRVIRKSFNCATTML